MHLRGRIHEAHNPIYNESLMIEIETLQWVLSQVDIYQNKNSVLLQ